MFEDYYRLSGPPFQLSPDPHFYFASRGHSRAFAYLKYGLVQREGFVLITGDVGAGKTTLLRALASELDKHNLVAGQIVSTQLDADDLLRAVALAFGLPAADDKAALLARIQSFLVSLARENRRALLTVDEAQNLTPRAVEELRMLSNFQLGDQTLLQSFLVGQPELREMIRGPSMKQLRQRISASCHLGPMDLEETRTYVLHRLGRVGWRDDPRLDEAIFAPLHEASGGIPRMINAIAGRLLLGAYLLERHEIGTADIDRTLAELREEVGLEVGAEQPAAPLSVSNSGIADAARPLQASTVSARLDRIERHLQRLLDVVLHNTDPEAKGGTGPSARPRRLSRWSVPPVRG